MARERKSGADLQPVRWIQADARRRAQRALAALERDAADERRSLARELRSLRSDYRRDLGELMGTGDARRYRERIDGLADASRARRIRDASRLLDEIGFDRRRGDRLRQGYAGKARRLLEASHVRLDATRPPVKDVGPSPWVTYEAPFHGSSWSFNWDRSDEALDPVLARYLDWSTGEIGSSIHTRLSGADDDDFLTAEYYTALNVWHTALATGQIEGWVALAFRRSAYSGSVADETGFSNATYSQLARTRFRVADAQGTADSQETRLYNYINTAWGDSFSWQNYVANANDLHWYYFRTGTVYPQGSTLLLEAGVWHNAWFIADDQSIRTNADLELRLQLIKVRSRPS